MWLVGNMILQCLNQSRFAYACITRKQDHLSAPIFDLCPTFQEERDFRCSPNQRCETTSTHDVQAVLRTAFAQYLIQGDRLRTTSECLGSQVLTLEIALD